jgi:hypothetical protein
MSIPSKYKGSLVSLTLDKFVGDINAYKDLADYLCEREDFRSLHYKHEDVTIDIVASKDVAKNTFGYAYDLLSCLIADEDNPILPGSGMLTIQFGDSSSRTTRPVSPRASASVVGSAAFPFSTSSSSRRPASPPKIPAAGSSSRRAASPVAATSSRRAASPPKVPVAATSSRRPSPPPVASPKPRKGECVEETSATYQASTRIAPRYDPSKCQGQRRKGQDGLWYTSTPTARGGWAWKKESN